MSSFFPSPTFEGWLPAEAGGDVGSTSRPSSIDESAATQLREENVSRASSMGFVLSLARCFPLVPHLAVRNTSRSSATSRLRRADRETMERLSGEAPSTRRSGTERKYVKEHVQPTPKGAVEGSLRLFPPVVRMSGWTNARTVPTLPARSNLGFSTSGCAIYFPALRAMTCKTPHESC